MSFNKTTKIVLSIVCALIFCVSLFQIARIYALRHRSKVLNSNLVNEAVVINTELSMESSADENSPITVDFDALLSKNKDVIA